VIADSLRALGQPVTDDDFANEIALSNEIAYEPMFMTAMTELIFPWEVVSDGDGDTELCRIDTARGPWEYRRPQCESSWNDSQDLPVTGESDHDYLVAVCQEVDSRTDSIRAYLRDFRARVGDDGVVVLGHPHPSWLGYQIAPEMIFYQWTDNRDLYRRSMEAVFQASLVIARIAVDEGIDFISDSCYGLEMTSPDLFATMDLPFIQRLSAWTHAHDGLFWYHNCGFTSRLIADGVFDLLGADVIETIAPPPEGDNDLAASRRALSRGVCSKGSFNLTLLHDGTVDEVESATREMVAAVRGYPHILSTADAVLEGTPAENYIRFVRTCREMA
jgi:hypothetical protein